MAGFINTLILLAMVVDFLATRISKEKEPPFRWTSAIAAGIFTGLVWTLCIGLVLNSGQNGILAMRLGLVVWLFMDKYMTNEVIPLAVYLSLCVPLVAFAGV